MKRTAWAVMAALLALSAVYGFLLSQDPAAQANTYGLPGLLPAVMLVFGATAALLIRRQPRNRIGWILAFVAIELQLTLVVQLLSDRSQGWPHWAAFLVQWLTGWMFVPGTYTIATYLILLFPDGRLPSRAWRWPAAVVGLIALTSVAAWAYDDLNLAQHPTRAGGTVQNSEGLLGTLEVSGFLTSIVSVAAVVQRYRRSDAINRLQLRWLAYAFALFVGALLLEVGMAIASGASNPPRWTADVFALGLATIPVAMAVAILRYRLFDVDLVISRTLVYAALAAFITGVYVGIVVGLGSLVGGAGRPNLGLSILATAVVAVAFQPLRERLQRLANRLVYGHRASPYEVLADFSRQVASSYAGEEALVRMAEVLAEGTGAEQAAVYVGERRVAVHPPSSNGGAGGETRSVEVWHQGARLGRVEVRKRRGDQVAPLEEKLLGDLAHQAGLVLSNVGLTADLRARLEDLRASRQRLVQAQDEERRRLERNLHDGAQQHLVALKVRLGLAEAVARNDPAKLPPLLADLQSEADATLATMRELAHGIYPPLLAERGLPEALESQARRATLPVTVEAGGLGRYPQEVEAAVYFCVLEALQNVQKYALASTAAVRLRAADGMLTFEVSDDGIGFDPAAVKPGAGLANLRDRLDALNGDLVIESRPGAGTTLCGRVSLAPGGREAVGAEL